MKLPVIVHADAFQAFTVWIVLVGLARVELTQSALKDTKETYVQRAEMDTNLDLTHA